MDKKQPHQALAGHPAGLSDATAVVDRNAIMMVPKIMPLSMPEVPPLIAPDRLELRDVYHNHLEIANFRWLQVFGALLDLLVDYLSALLVVFGQDILDVDLEE